MGWARSLYYLQEDRRPSTPQYDVKEASRLAKKNARGLPRDPTTELLAICADNRTPVSETDPPFIDPDEIEKHNNLIDGICGRLSPKIRSILLMKEGIVIDNRVYDVTTFMEIHPGGPSMFEQFAGKQCTWQVSRSDKRHGY